MATGNINVTAENIFPIIKKFLYSDHEIFLRELISNATDATLKLKHLSTLGEVKGDIGELMIEIKVDKENKQIRIIDQGVGMTGEEVEKYKDKVEDSGIIGHFGLGFYSSFMVASKVEIFTKSFFDASFMFKSAVLILEGLDALFFSTISKISVIFF